MCVLVCRDHLRYSETGCEGRNGGSSSSVQFVSAISLGLTLQNGKGGVKTNDAFSVHLKDQEAPKCS